MSFKNRVSRINENVAKQPRIDRVWLLHSKCNADLTHCLDTIFIEITSLKNIIQKY